jgi:iron(III) transport system ATP-binding protein
MRFEGIGDVPLPAAVPADASLVFRPQNVRLLKPDEPQPAGGFAAAGIVANREFLGSTIRYGVQVGDAELLVEEPHFGGSRTYDVGSTVTILLDLDQALFVGP